MKKYTTKQGDTWDIVALNLFDNQKLVDELFRSNLDHADVIIFDAGTVLNVPEIEVVANVNIPPWERNVIESDEAIEAAPFFNFERSREPSYRWVDRYVKMMINNSKFHMKG